MTWTPWAALAGALGYGTLKVYWAVGHAPAWVFGSDLTLPGGLVSALCGAGAAVVIGLRLSGGRLPLVVAAWALSVALMSASAMILLDVVGGILPGLGIPRDGIGFLSRLACAGVAVLVGATALSYQRRTRGDCLRCSRTDRRPPASTPVWAYAAGYAAVAGCLLRLLAQFTMGVDIPYRGGADLMIFETGFVLAGVLLPLALVHSWGRVWPRWVLPLAGRKVPRWLVAGPGFGIAGALIAYFGVGLTQIVAETIDGTLEEAAFMWVAVPAYTVWGIGLAVASVSYHRITRPPCTGCGR
ncbi:hypothetical protein FHR32_004546 [Streptosporangium album]|uniref:Uncharacterized protein n=1 Tax=Streptosporangium album TaxID=47479 RepID=A0A7W7RZJ7_9ACTN|nr:hypothetical protein [Streptosporangium album]MBB4940241.1 hypothetical protein [Streptosporangium album]